MYEQICNWMQWRSDLLNSERLDDLLGEYIYPMVIYQDELNLVVQGPEDLLGGLRRLRDWQISRGIVRMEAKVKAMDLPRNGRMRVWVSYVTLDGQSRTVTQTEVIHFCREMANGLKTEMLDYGPSPLPPSWVAMARRVALSG